MSKHTTPESFKGQDEDKELSAVYEYLQHNIATATMVAVDLDIYRPNLSWRKRALEKTGKLKVVKIGICPVTKHKAAFLTTNPDLFPVKSQLSLFDAWEGKGNE